MEHLDNFNEGSLGIHPRNQGDGALTLVQVVV